MTVEDKVERAQKALNILYGAKLNLQFPCEYKSLRAFLKTNGCPYYEAFLKGLKREGILIKKGNYVTFQDMNDEDIDVSIIQHYIDTASLLNVESASKNKNHEGVKMSKIDEAIDLLKSKGYRIQKPIYEVVNYEII